MEKKELNIKDYYDIFLKKRKQVKQDKERIAQKKKIIKR